MKKIITLRHVAQALGVSDTTVSRAISGNSGISEATRKRVLEACEQMGYTINYMAQALAGRKSKLIGLLMGNIANSYMSNIAANIENRAHSKGYQMILSNSMNDPEREIKCFALLMSRQVDGIILVPASNKSYSLLEKYIIQIPTVFLGESLENIRASYITVDNYHGAYLGTSHLISLGHNNILYLGRRSKSITHRLRGKGYKDACAAASLTPHFLDNTINPSSTIEDGYRLGSQVFSGPFSYTAIFAASDAIALGVMQAADEAGLHIPDDISLIGFDDIAFSKLPRIDLTTISQPIETMAASATDLLIEHIESPSTSYAHRAMTPVLIERSTCKRIRQEV